MGLLDFFDKGKDPKQTEADKRQADFVKEMHENAESCIEFFKPMGYEGLDFSINSLETLDDMLDEVSDYFDDMKKERQNMIVTIAGSYIFEVARTNFGGKYYWYDRLDQPIFVTGQPHFEISLLAFEKVKGRIMNGNEDNIPFFFKGYEEKVKNAKTGDTALIV